MVVWPWAVAGVVVLLGMLVLGRSLMGLFRLLGRWVGSFALLYLVQPVGLGLGVNGVNALVVALLGAPGFGLLLMVQWVLR